MVMSSSLAISPLAKLYDELKSFLATSEIVDRQGNVYSWLNDARPGYIYPEIMGFYVNLASQLSYTQGATFSSESDRSLRLRTHAVARQLQSLIPPSGGIGKQGKIYVFDSCMAISGLLAYKKYLQGDVDEKILLRLAAFTSELLQCRLVLLAEDRSSLQRSHWSTTFGASMLKTAIALDGLTRETGSPRYIELALEITDEIISSCFRDGQFKAFPQTNSVYCHAHCYALEGLLHLQTRGDRHVTSTLQAGVEQLRVWQNADGSLFNWYCTPLRRRQKVADATAQAIRLWLAVDRQAYADNIERGFNFLASLQAPQQGIYYRAGSQDRNSWASLFTLQALDWYYNGIKSDCLV